MQPARLGDCTFRADCPVPAGVAVLNQHRRLHPTRPIVYNSLYNGETYDARLEQAIAGWAEPGFDDGFGDAALAAWTAVVEAKTEVNNATLASQLFQPIRQVHDSALGGTWPRCRCCVISCVQSGGAHSWGGGQGRGSCVQVAACPLVVMSDSHPA